jgi:phytol kinase
MTLILTVLLVFILLVVSELWSRKRSKPTELSRKFVHITVGSFVAFWPFFLRWPQILFLSAAFLVVVGVSKYVHIFQAIHSVQRATWGELFFALAVGGVALVTHSKGVYAVALLQMSLADGLAAIVGIRYGKNSQYKILGSTKSLVGTVTFFVISVGLLIGYTHFSGVDIPVLYLLALGAATSLVENLGVYGLDNLLVPLIIAYALTI